jgi:hypothetical protein
LGGGFQGAEERGRAGGMGRERMWVRADAREMVYREEEGNKKDAEQGRRYYGTMGGRVRRALEKSHRRPGWPPRRAPYKYGGPYFRDGRVARRERS